MRRNFAGQTIVALLVSASSSPPNKPIVPFGTADSGGGMVKGPSANNTLTVKVSKDGAAPVAATGSVGDANHFSPGTTINPLNPNYGQINASTFGLWFYQPTAAETDANQVTFIFGANVANPVRVSLRFEPTYGPLEFQGSVFSATSQSATQAVFVLNPFDAGTAQNGGSTTTIKLRAAASFADSELNGLDIYITAGTCLGQRRTINSYVGATNTATVSVAWTGTPDNTSVYEIGTSAPSANTDAYKNAIVVVQSATSGQIIVGLCTAYNGSTRAITMTTTAQVFTIATGNLVTIIADA